MLGKGGALFTELMTLLTENNRQQLSDIILLTCMMSLTCRVQVSDCSVFVDIVHSDKLESCGNGILTYFNCKIKETTDLTELFQINFITHLGH